MIDFVELLADSPVVAAVKETDDLQAAIDSDCRIMILMCGDLCSVSDMVERCKACGKIVILHVDLITGLEARTIYVDYVRRFTKADGVTSTRPAVVKYAKEQGLIAGLRTFVVDSRALAGLISGINNLSADYVEILPGVSTSVIRKVRAATDLPLIAGGLIEEKTDIYAALSAGADAISTTRTALWQS